MHCYPSKGFFGTALRVARFGLRARGPKHHRRRAYRCVFTQQAAQTECATTRMHPDLKLQFQNFDLDFANNSLARSPLNGTKVKCPSPSIPTKRI